jgi:hypothetical protein
MNHAVGIHQLYRLGKRSDRRYIARCDTCGWENGYETSADVAQQLAVEHNGGTLRTVERRTRLDDPSLGTAEMFPGVA